MLCGKRDSEHLCGTHSHCWLLGLCGFCPHIYPNSLPHSSQAFVLSLKRGLYFLLSESGSFLVCELLLLPADFLPTLLIPQTASNTSVFQGALSNVNVAPCESRLASLQSSYHNILIICSVCLYMFNACLPHWVVNPGDQAQACFPLLPLHSWFVLGAQSLV